MDKRTKQTIQTKRESIQHRASSNLRVKVTGGSTPKNQSNNNKNLSIKNGIKPAGNRKQNLRSNSGDST
jgi:hypothetical protein